MLRGHLAARPWLQPLALDPLAWAGLAAAGGVVAALWLLRDRIGRGPLAGVLFFGVTLAPTLGFVDYHFILFSFVADRFSISPASAWWRSWGSWER